MADKATKAEKKRAKKGEAAAAEAPAEEVLLPELPLQSSLLDAMSGAQKAAAVIVSLGVDKASQLYQYMEPEDVEMITIEVAKLGYLDADTTEAVLNEYYQMCMTDRKSVV